MQALQIGKDAKYLSLRDICTDIPMTPATPMLMGCMILTPKDVSKVLEVMEEDPQFEHHVVQH